MTTFNYGCCGHFNTRAIVLSRMFHSLCRQSFSLVSTRLGNTPKFQSRSGLKYRALCVNTLLNSSNNNKNGGTLEGEKSKEKTDFFIYNTMSRQKELFEPREPGRVGMYVCGVTTYDYSHIGHARVYVTFDLLYRYLMHLGYDVKYVRNFTDIDDKVKLHRGMGLNLSMYGAPFILGAIVTKVVFKDFKICPEDMLFNRLAYFILSNNSTPLQKIIARANESKEDPLSLSDRFCKEFHVDMAKLYCLPPSVEPRVTDHICNIIEMIQKILTNGSGYVVENGDVYFSVDSYPEYGHLSGRKLDDNRAGERVAVDIRKRNPADFALWKSAKPGEPSWESPWGPGRPGWHIECSAMSAAHLGHSFDIHGGGVDLIFPHHENEIAQSSTACSKSHVRYWMHNGFVTINAEKMSKSLGNFFTIREVLESYHPLALRLFLSGTHYRSPLNYSKSQLESASDRIFYIYQTLKDCEECLSGYGREGKIQPVPNTIIECIDKVHSAFASSMSDDMHAHIALAALLEPLRIMNDLMFTRQGRKQKSRMESLEVLEKEVSAILIVLGLLCPNYAEVLLQLKKMALKRAGLSEDQLQQFIEERAEARASKNYAESDKIRRKLSVMGIALMDGPSGTTWRPGTPLEEEAEHVAS